MVKSKTRRPAAVLVLALLTLARPSGAFADVDCHSSLSAVQGATRYVGPSPTRGYAAWDKGARTLTTKASLHTSATNRCVTTVFGWATASGHFDGRIRRNCYKSTATPDFSGAMYENNVAGRVLLGMQKWGACYGAPNTEDGCFDGPYSVPGCSITTMNMVLTTTNFTTRYWVKHADGSTAYWDGGNPGAASS